MSEKVEKMPPVPPFVRFVAAAVPMVFDDSLSYYEALCALWKYIQNTVDVINNNATVTEDTYIYSVETRALYDELKTYVDTYFDNLDVQDEVNNKLDEMTEDGTLERLLGDVLDYKLTFADLFFPKTTSGNDPEGFCGVLKTSRNSAILFDLGRTDNYTAIKNSLDANGVEKIDAVVISHYHTDHVGSLTSFQADYDMSDTVYYLPYAPNYSGLNKYAEIIANYNGMVGAIGANTIVYPTENQSVTIGDYTLDFNNCGSVTIAYWDSTETTDYNSYSMITYVHYGNTTVAFTGDMTLETQNYLYDNHRYEEVDIVTAPHHSHNYSVNSGLALEYGATAVYAADSKGITKSVGYQDNFSQAFGLFGAKMYRNTSNDDEIHFYLYKNGYNTAAYGQPCSLYGYAGVITYKVQNSYTGNKSTGSSDHPFTSIRAAFEMCKTGGTYVIDVTDMSASGEGVYIRDIHNVTVNIPAGTYFTSLSFNQCSNIFIEPVSTAWSVDSLVEIFNCRNIRLRGFSGGVNDIRFSSDITLREITFTKATSASYVTHAVSSQVLIQDCSTDLTRTYFLTAEKSNVKFIYEASAYPNVTSIYNETTTSEAFLGNAFSNAAAATKAYGSCANTSPMIQVDGIPGSIFNGAVKTFAQAYRTNWGQSLSFTGVDAIVMVNATNVFSVSKYGGSYHVETIHGSNSNITITGNTGTNTVSVSTTSDSRIAAIVVK